MKNKYYDTAEYGFKYICGAGLKYASLIIGVYSMCKDEKDFGIATLAGLGYITGEIIHRINEEKSAARNFSTLEKELRKSNASLIESSKEKF